MGKKGKGGGGGGGGKSKSVPSRQSSNKDSGLPAFFKHRKLANLPGQNKQNQVEKGKGKEQVSSNSKANPSFSDSQSITRQKQREEDQDEAMSAPSTSNGFNALISATSDVSANDEIIFGKDSQDRETVDAALAIKDSSSKAYARELRKVIDLADVLIEVLDARDPLGCR